MVQSRFQAHSWFQALLAIVVALIVFSSSTTVALAQAEDPAEPTTEPAPPVTPVPNDPLVNEGASDELDPNTTEPVDPNAAPGDDAGVSPTEEESCEPDANAAASDAAETVADEPCTPKKRGRYANQPEFVPDSLNRGEARRVERELESARADHSVRISRVRGLRLLEKRLDLERQALSAETIEALRLLEETEEQLRQRALATFVQGDSFSLAPSLEHDDILRHQQQQFLVDEVLSLDRELLDRYTALRAELQSDALELYDRQANGWEWLRLAKDKAQLTAERVDQLQFELETWNNLSATFIENVVWPIDGTYDEPLINSWGYPRAPGTIDEHWHEGIDIFAPEGERLVAAEGGTVTDIGVGTLGGLKIWIMGDSGTRWYYAHLMAFNPDLSEGDIVEAGDLIGYVGKTGNAISTPPHLHLQMHPDGGRPVNPFPILKAASDRYQAGIGRTVVESVPVVGFDGTRVLPNGSTQGQIANRETAPAPVAAPPADPDEPTSGVEVEQPDRNDRARIAGAVPAETSAPG